MSKRTSVCPVTFSWRGHKSLSMGNIVVRCTEVMHDSPAAVKNIFIHTERKGKTEQRDLLDRLTQNVTFPRQWILGEPLTFHLNTHLLPWIVLQMFLFKNLYYLWRSHHLASSPGRCFLTKILQNKWHSHQTQLCFEFSAFFLSPSNFITQSNASSTNLLKGQQQHHLQ